MAKYVIVKLDEATSLSSTLASDLMRFDDVPIDRQRLLIRVNAMIKSLVEAADQPNKIEDIYDYLAEEYGECLSAIYVLEQLMAACQKLMEDRVSRLLDVRLLDDQGDVILRIS